MLILGMKRILKVQRQLENQGSKGRQKVDALIPKPTIIVCQGRWWLGTWNTYPNHLNQQ